MGGPSNVAGGPAVNFDPDIGKVGVEPLYAEGDPRAAKFDLPPDAPVCDIVMKGGVTSGLVYPYAVLRLARKFRLAGIGGTSAGAIAAALTAAAEYARQKHDDKNAFSRFEARCLELPRALNTLFQPHKRHRAVFAFATDMMQALDTTLALGDRALAFFRLFHTRAALITWFALGGMFGGGILASVRYVWKYGVHEGIKPTFGYTPHPIDLAACLAYLGDHGLAKSVAAAYRTLEHNLTTDIGPLLLKSLVLGEILLACGLLMTLAAVGGWRSATRLTQALYLAIVALLAAASTQVSADQIAAVMFNEGVLTGLLAGAVGLISGVILMVCFAASIRIRKRTPMLAYTVLVALSALVSCIWPLGSIAAVTAPAALGGALGVLVTVVFVADRVTNNLTKTDFGLCSGLGSPKAEHPALTNWLHEAIQHVAGRTLADPSLTFGDIENASCGSHRLALRMIVTNMSQARPYALPDLDGAKEKDDLGWRPSEWAKLFPHSVVTELVRKCPPTRGWKRIRRLPSGLDLPVVVGARMSLSFPLLFSGVPVYHMPLVDSGPGTPAEREAAARMLLIDGGLSSNMPLHFFDNLGPPAHPTFAINLFEDRKLMAKDVPRLQDLLGASEQRLAQPGDAGELRKLIDERIGLHPPDRDLPRGFDPILARVFSAYLRGLFGAAKDWQDNLLSIMPGQFDRIVRIGLGPREGGLNLVMPEQRSGLLMQLGYLAGGVLSERFDLPAHRVRRAIAAYEEIRRVGGAFARNWSVANLGEELMKDIPNIDPQTSAAWADSRVEIIEKFTALARWSEGLAKHSPAHPFPRPRGSLRITPNLSGDS